MNDIFVSKSAFYVLLVIDMVSGMLTFPDLAVMTTHKMVSKSKRAFRLASAFLVVSFVPLGMVFSLNQNWGFFRSNHDSFHFLLFWFLRLRSENRRAVVVLTGTNEEEVVFSASG
ncbi:hypothetical protein FEI15_01390 [Lacticaseibacillus zeae]|uniref:Uncharacterized protein n=1 Tax=Lacticaseibacillus zeae TaxID=57037 RepID=A0A5R8LX03_LACZE|nr:hypothetical protein [Lacticaseibacillus zeae]TLF41891.1 hypothetical protein FEI15_01390 [Lacticaseibacillus zeae]